MKLEVTQENNLVISLSIYLSILKLGLKFYLNPKSHQVGLKIDFKKINEILDW